MTFKESQTWSMEQTQNAWNCQKIVPSLHVRISEPNKLFIKER